MFTLFNLLLIFSNWAIFLLRLVVGVIFLSHGIPKIKDLKANRADFQKMGFKPGWLWGTIVAVLEVVGGIFLMLGIWVQLAALILAGQMIVAVLWKVIKGQKFVGGYEFDLLLIAATLILATMGSGVLSLRGLF